MKIIIAAAAGLLALTGCSSGSDAPSTNYATFVAEYWNDLSPVQQEYVCDETAAIGLDGEMTEFYRGALSSGVDSLEAQRLSWAWRDIVNEEC